MNIITNNKPRPLVCLVDLPATTVAAEFEYVKDEDAYSPRFVSYKGHWYDVFDTEASPYVCGPGRVLEGWDSFISESFFSGVLFRFVGDDEVICGRYYS